MSEPSVADRLMSAYEKLEERDQQAVAAAKAAASAGPQQGRTVSTLPFGGSSSSSVDASPDDMDTDEDATSGVSGAARGRLNSSLTFGGAKTYGAAPTPPDGAWLGSLLAEGMMAQLGRGYGTSAGEMPFPASSVAPMSDSSRDQMHLLQHKLNQRLGPEYVESRRGNGGKNVEYIEGWKAIDLANEVFGFNGWSTAIRSLEIDFCDIGEDGKVRISASCIMRITLRDGTYHEDVGCGMMEGGNSKGQGVQKCKKEAVTDAIKRTLKTFGRLTGNCLYDSKFREQIKKMKAAPAKYDLSNLKRGPDPVAAQGYKDDKARHDAAELERAKQRQQQAEKPQQNAMQRASTSAAAVRSVAPAPARNSTMGPPPAPAAAAAPSKSKPAPSEPAAPATGLGPRATTTPAPGAASEPDPAREERRRLAAQRKEENARKRQAEQDAAAAVEAFEAAAAAQAHVAAPSRAQTSAARLPSGAAAAPPTDAALQRPSTSQMFNDMDETELSGAMEEFEARPAAPAPAPAPARTSNQAEREPDSDDFAHDPLDDDDGAAIAMMLDQAGENDSRARDEQEMAAQRRKEDVFNDSAIAMSDTSMAEVKKEYADGVGQAHAPPRRAGSKGRFNNDPAARARAAATGSTSGATSLSAIGARRTGGGLGTAQRTSPRTERTAPLKRSATSVENMAQYADGGSAQGQPLGHGFTGAGAVAGARAKAAPYPAAASRASTGRQQLGNLGQAGEDAAKRARYS